MDAKELHYVTFDPDEIWSEMMEAYAEAGGDALYPGDEKEMLLRGVQNALVLAFAGIDNGLRMGTLRYAVRDYLDLIGESRGCPRIEAEPAAAEVAVTLAATGAAVTLPAGTAFSADGKRVYKLAEAVMGTGAEETVTAAVVCAEAGSAGNGLALGTVLQPLTHQPAVSLVVCTVGASGGRDKETDEAYRERIRLHAGAAVTTGPAEAYEAAAMDVSSGILDANAVRTDDGEVTVYLLLESQTGAADILAAVEAALNDRNVRPLTDTVYVAQATAVSYTLKAKYWTDGSAGTASGVASAIEEYQAWQDGTIGRAFNPDRLAALMYQAGATRVAWDTGSEFDGGTVEYTEIDPDQVCAGTITAVVAS